MYLEMNESFKKDGYNGSLAQQFLLIGVNEIKEQLQNQIKSVNRASSIKMAGNVFLGGGLMTNVNYLLKKIGKKNVN